MSLACDLKTLTCPPMPLNHIWEPLDATVRKKKKMLQILKRFAGKFNYLTDEYRPSSFLYSKNANTYISGAVANMKQITFQVIQIHSCSRWKQDYVSNKNTNQLQLLIYRAYVLIIVSVARKLPKSLYRGFLIIVMMTVDTVMAATHFAFSFYVRRTVLMHILNRAVSCSYTGSVVARTQRGLN